MRDWFKSDLEKLGEVRDLSFICIVEWRRKLLMVNVNGDSVKEGAIYGVVGMRGQK